MTTKPDAMVAAANTTRPSASGDDVYAALVEAHRGLTDQQSQRLNARLVLLLIDRVGDGALVIEAIRRARTGLEEADR